MRRIVMTGATGNTGSKVLRRLLREDAVSEVVALLHRQNLEPDLAADRRVAGVRCDLNDPSTWRHRVTSDHILVETANIRHGNTLLPFLEDMGIRRAFCVTTTGVFSAYHSYNRLYREIEDRLRESSVEVTILRPSMIYGNARDHNMHRLIDFVRKMPIFPVFGGGKYLMQPVYVEDLAWGIAEAFIRDAYGEFNLAGAKELTYLEVVETIIEQIPTRTLLIPVNHTLAASVVRVLERVPGFPLSHEQVMRLVEDKVFDISPAQKALDYKPRDFQAGIRLQLEELGVGERR